MLDRWRAEFECEDGGQFSDFAGAKLVPEHCHRSPQVPLPHELARTKSHDDEQDEDESGGPAV
jgi:hypothetical protein